MKKETIKKATTRLIDSVWTISYIELPDNKAKVIAYNREDEEGYRKERQLPQCTVIEDEKRNIVGILIRNTFEAFGWVNAENCDQHLIVTNPKNVFSYREDE